MDSRANHVLSQFRTTGLSPGPRSRHPLVAGARFREDPVPMDPKFDDNHLDLGIFQWEFQDPKMEILYHIRPYFVGIFPEK